MNDDPAQGEAARQALGAASLIAFTVPALCELVWVLSRIYKRPRPEIAAAIRLLVDADVAVTDRPTVDAGLAVLDAGGDFADGAIAHAGRMLGGTTFLTFDEAGASLVRRTGGEARAVVDAH